MQASQIQPHNVYAIHHNNKLVRFKIDAVVQRRINNYGNPHDYQSSVEGHILAADANLPNGATLAKLTVAPDAILGPYDQQVELVAREKAEKEAARTEEVRRTHEVGRLVKLLREKTGLHDTERCAPISAGYSHRVQLSYEAVEALLKHFDSTVERLSGPERVVGSNPDPQYRRRT